MALPVSLGNYTLWDSTDILNRFKDGDKPTVENWEAMRPYLFPMLTQTDAQARYTVIKNAYDQYIKQGNVLDNDFFSSLFEAMISFNNYPFAACYIDTHSPYYLIDSEQTFVNAFGNGKTPDGTIFAGYWQALLSPTVFANTFATGFDLVNVNDTDWVKNRVIGGSIKIATASNVRAHQYANTVYSASGNLQSLSPFTLRFGKYCMCGSPYVNANVTLVLLCSGKATDVGETTLTQTSIIGITDDELFMPIVKQTSSSQFTLQFDKANATLPFILSAYSSAAVSAGIAEAYIMATD